MSNLNRLILNFHHMAVHNKIRVVRISKGLSQSNMADELGIDTANYGRMERGQTKITLDRLEAIANILEVEVNDLMNNNNEYNNHQNSTSHTTSQIETNDLLQEILLEIKIINQHLKSTKK